MLETTSGRHRDHVGKPQKLDVGNDYRLMRQIQRSVSCNRLQSCMYNNTAITHPSHGNEVYIDKETLFNNLLNEKSMIKRPLIDLVHLRGVMKSSTALRQRHPQSLTVQNHCAITNSMLWSLETLM